MEIEWSKNKKQRSKLCSPADMISELPDSVIHIVFSFLDTREAVQTCILSKRWKNIWISLPYLQFTALNTRKRAKSCLNFIQQVLLRRECCPVIKLCFVSKSDIVSSLAESLVYYAVKHHVQNLTLQVCCQDIHLPDCFSLASKSIQVLELTCFSIDATINWVNLSHLSSLTTLHISGFRDFDGKFLSSCPNLEILKIHGLYRMASAEFNIHSQSLKTLEIHSNLPRDCVCSLMVPKLTHFTYCSSHLWLLSLKFSSPMEALDVVAILIPIYFGGNSTTEDSERFINSFQAFRNAKSIVLCQATVIALSKSPGYLEEHPSSFPRLKNLKLTSDFKVPASVLLYFLNSSTILSVAKSTHKRKTFKK